MVRTFTVGLFLTLAVVRAQTPQPVLGIQQIEAYESKLKGKRVALLVNQTSAIGNVHLVDLLKSLNIDIKNILSPEHGFRGDVPDGVEIANSKDAKTGIPIISLYGSNKKPTPEQLADVDIVVFDIQDVGTRFYTYISTLHYLMEACAENKKKVMVLDRPNPNSFVDGPVLQPALKSFVGMHPIPIAHGLTIGEYAMMINGEGWLGEDKQCDLEVIKVKFWSHGDPFHVPIKPSPNLPNNNGITWYPSTCLFEGTALSVGRGTQHPFEFIGHPDLKNQPFQFTPVAIPNMAKNPPHENKVCFGIDLRNERAPRKIDLTHLIALYKDYPDKEKFFIPYFDKLAGTPLLKEQIKQGLTADEISATWQKDLEEFKARRARYLLYP